MMIGLSLALPAVQRAGGLAFVAPSAGLLATLSSLGIGENGAGTYLIRLTVASLGTGAFQILLSIDANSTANAIYLRANATGSNALLVRTNSGDSAGNAVGKLSAGVQCALGISVDGLGGAIGTLNGAASVAVTGCPVAGLTSVRVGLNASGGQPLQGSASLVRILAGLALSETDLRAAVAAL